MSRLTLLTSTLAVLALGVGAIGYADTWEQPEEMRRAALLATDDAVSPARPALRGADAIIEVDGRKRLAAALLQSGVGGLDAALAEQAAADVAGRGQLWLGERVGPSARSLDRLSLDLGPGRRLILEKQGDAFVRREVVERIDLTPVRLRLDGGTGLAAELVQAGLPRETRDRVLDALGRGRPAAAIDLIVAHEASPSASRYGDPLYLGAFEQDGSVRRWIGGDGHLRPLGDDKGEGGLLRPLPGPVTSSPGLRFHPILRFLRWHRGTDFASPSGTPVQAALAGRVVVAGWQGGYGRLVRLAHADGSQTLYAHLSAIDVAEGAAVPQGMVIGRVGASGLATGPHLHFEWQRSGTMLRPAFGDVAAGAASPRQQAALRSLLSAPYRLPPERRKS